MTEMCQTICAGVQCDCYFSVPRTSVQHTLVSRHITHASLVHPISLEVYLLKGAASASQDFAFCVLLINEEGLEPHSSAIQQEALCKSQGAKEHPQK